MYSKGVWIAVCTGIFIFVFTFPEVILSEEYCAYSILFFPQLHIDNRIFSLKLIYLFLCGTVFIFYPVSTIIIHFSDCCATKNNTYGLEILHILNYSSILIFM